MGPFTLSLFRYDGLRPVAGAPFDRFERTRLRVYIRPMDAASPVSSYLSMGGIRTARGRDLGLSARAAASNSFATCSVAGSLRKRATRDRPTQRRASRATASSSMGYGPTENTRLTIEDVISHTPQTTNTMNAQFSIAY